MESKIGIQFEGGLTLKRGHMEFSDPPDPLHPDVFVGELSERDKEALAKGEVVTGINLGDNLNDNFTIRLTEAQNQHFHDYLMRRSDKAYILIWEGNKVPRGTEIAGHRILGTQNGFVENDKGIIIGVYDRIMEFGGESKKGQQMIVFMTEPIT